MGEGTSQEEIRGALDRFANEDVSEKQQNFIASLIKQTGIDGTRFKELVKDKAEGEPRYNKRQASRIIDHLIELRDQNRAHKTVNFKKSNDSPAPLADSLSDNSKQSLNEIETDLKLQETGGDKEDPPF